MNTLDRLIPECMSFQSPDSSQRHDRLLDAFVDDTLLEFTDHGLVALENMIVTFNQENIMFYSGAALNLSKCSWYTMFWDWKNGRPFLRQIKTEDPSLTVTTQGIRLKSSSSSISPPAKQARS